MMSVARETAFPRVLIVEDQYFVALDCELQLQAAGYECVGLASTGAAALDLAERERPDLVLMDINLIGRTDGIQTAIAIYERLGIRSIFASAHADPLTRQQAQRAQPLGWLDKPYTGEELIEAVRSALPQVRCEHPISAAESASAPTIR